MYRRINHIGNRFLSLRPGAGSKRESLRVLVPGTLASLREGERGGTFQALLMITSLPGPEPQLYPTPMQLSVKDNFSSSELVFVPVRLRDWYAMSLVGFPCPNQLPLFCMESTHGRDSWATLQAEYMHLASSWGAM